MLANLNHIMPSTHYMLWHGGHIVSALSGSESQFVMKQTLKTLLKAIQDLSAKINRITLGSMPE